ncbi:hypothetical protein [Rhodanobacter sp. BL-MT-08]
MALVVALAIYFSYRHIVNAKAVLWDRAQASPLGILQSRIRTFMPWRMYLTTSK